MNFLEACRKAISIDSTPSTGSIEMAKFVKEFGHQLGFAVEIQEESIAGHLQGNVILRVPNAPEGPELLLQTHMDTVEPGNLGFWTRTEQNPFNASIYSDEIVGLGVAAAKLDLLCKVKAASEFLQKDITTPFVIVGSFGEESGMHGATRLIRRKKVNAKWALVGEPTDLHIGVAGPGIAVLEVIIPFTEEEKKYHQDHNAMESSTTQSKIFRGKPAHASSPESGENAIEKMLDYLDELPEGLVLMDVDGGVTFNTVPESCVLEFDMVGSFRGTMAAKLSTIYSEVLKLKKEFRQFRSEGFSPDHPTLNIGSIRTFRDQIQVIGSCRLLPSATEKDYENWLGRLENVCEAQGAKFRVRDMKQAFSTDSSSKILTECISVAKEEGLSIDPKKIPTCTEASVFSRLGIECLVFGAGKSIGNAHEPNESVKISDLEKAQSFYRSTIERICL